MWFLLTGRMYTEAYYRSGIYIFVSKVDYKIAKMSQKTMCKYTTEMIMCCKAEQKTEVN